MVLFSPKTPKYPSPSPSLRKHYFQHFLQLPYFLSFFLFFQGRGLYAKTNFKERDVILTETPLVCAQFSWNELYKYAACEFCLRSLETAEDMSRRLSDNPAVVLPHPECCEVDSSSHTYCPHCQVCVARDILCKSYAYI